MNSLKDLIECVYSGVGRLDRFNSGVEGGIGGQDWSSAMLASSLQGDCGSGRLGKVISCRGELVLLAGEEMGLKSRVSGRTTAAI